MIWSRWACVTSPPEQLGLSEILVHMKIETWILPSQ